MAAPAYSAVDGRTGAFRMTVSVMYSALQAFMHVRL